MRENVAVFLRVKPEDEFEDACIEVTSKTSVTLTATGGKETPSRTPFKKFKTPFKMMRRGNTPETTPSKRPSDKFSTPRSARKKGLSGPVPSTPGAAPSKDFTYDRVFAQEATQTEVYAEVEDYIKACVDGFNVTILAYGQTGSGKTHTMMGESGDPGVIPRAVSDVFAHIAQQSDTEFLLHASYVELYNNTFVDLLAPGKGGPDAEQVRLRDRAGVMTLEGGPSLATPVTSALEVRELLDRGAAARTVAATRLNAASSRSHAIFTLNLQGKTRDGSIISSRLHLVDLAGSERAKKSGVEGKQMAEATAINSSLSALGDVLSALTEPGDRVVPYRNSKLTLLLRDSLGGNSKTLMIATARPAIHHRSETQSTLQWAARAKLIRNRSKINKEVSDAAEIEKQNAEIAALKRRLEERDQEFASLMGQRAVSAEEQEVMAEKVQALLQRNEEEREDYERRISTILNAHEGEIASQNYAYAALQAKMELHRSEAHRLRVEKHLEEDEVAALREELGTMAEELEALRQARDGAVTQAKNFNERLKAVAERWAGEVDAYNRKIAGLEEELAAERAKNDEGSTEEVTELRKEATKARTVAKRALHEAKKIVEASARAERQQHKRIAALEAEVAALRREQAGAGTSRPLLASTPAPPTARTAAALHPADVTPIQAPPAATPHVLADSCLKSPALGRSSSGLLLPSIQAVDSPYLPRKAPRVRTEKQRQELEAAFPAMKGTITVADEGAPSPIAMGGSMHDGTAADDVPLEGVGSAVGAEDVTFDVDGGGMDGQDIELVSKASATPRGKRGGRGKKKGKAGDDEDVAEKAVKAAKMKKGSTKAGKKTKAKAVASPRVKLALKDKNQNTDESSPGTLLGGVEKSEALKNAGGKRKRKLFKAADVPFAKTPGKDMLGKFANGQYALPKLQDTEKENSGELPAKRQRLK